ncbi:MAG: zinc-dependent metalloprotease [Bdellovibrionales bacterium]|nr:zinc-dependent metalloprotease [Bdellovibrionales bacterium]
MKSFAKHLLVACLFAVLQSCGSQPTQEPWITSTDNNPVQGGLPSAQDPTLQTVSIQVTQTLSKRGLFNRDFLYSANLQYSSFYSVDEDLYLQSLTLNPVIVRFRIQGTELQMIADQTHKFPSDVNHPDQLIGRFQIVSETSETLTVRHLNSGAYLAQLFAAASLNGTLQSVTASSAVPPRDLWIRSSKYEKKDQLFLQETSVILQSGVIAEFMEYLFPRSAMDPSLGFEKILLDDPTGEKGFPGLGTSARAARYRLLPGDIFFQTEDKVAYAQHYDLDKPFGWNSSILKPGAKPTIDWYVTPNIPNEFLKPVSQALEGWNRYYEKMTGIRRPVIRFMGRLPKDIKIGDPRYNVINWDRKSEAGAAYETQSSDPFTGKQIHSLIYMPLSWYYTGKDFWKSGRSIDPIQRPGQPKSKSTRDWIRQTRFSVQTDLKCSKSLHQALHVLSSGTLSAADVEAFGIQLLKQTLFHEVGHALGLSHNFKGSLSYDPSKPASERIFSDSIMDYNQYEIERQAFNAVDTEKGPVLEYDRQALSALYNQGADIRPTDPVLPVCDDQEADADAEGVDPYCLRYDVEKEPTLSIDRALKRITETTLDSDTTLVQAISRVPSLELGAAPATKVLTAADLDSLKESMAHALVAPLRFFYFSGRASFSRTIRLNLASLRVFSFLPEGTDETALRLRVMDGTHQFLLARMLPDHVKDALTLAQQDFLGKIAATPGFTKLSAQEKSKFSESFKAKSDELIESFVQSPSNGLPKARAALLSDLTYFANSPYFMGSLSGVKKVWDAEDQILMILSETVQDAKDSSDLERTIAAESLSTFKNRMSAKPYFEKTKKVLTRQWKKAASIAERDLVESLFKALN